jgi:hypothetical protein
VDVGKLTLAVTWDGEVIRGADVRSTRPMAAQVLRDKTAPQVLQIVPLLFSVCGRAQGAAAAAALHAARHSTGKHADGVERMIACEALQEHLWRLLLDWPKLLELPPQEKQFAAWYALLRTVSSGGVDMAAFLHEFENDALGMTLEEWRGLDSYRLLQRWWHGSQSPLAKLLSKLDEMERNDTDERRLLPPWSAVEAHQACAGDWSAAFAARPEWQGAAAEAGAWSYHAADPLLRDVWQQRGSKVLARLLARIIDVIEMASGSAAPRLDVTSPARGEGVAVVRTARGLLLHRVHLAAERVMDYAIVAPTEWNFHPSGAFARGLYGVREPDISRVKQLAHVAALSLDPCVAYEIEVRHA